MELDCFVDGFLEECPKQSVLEQFQRESVDVSFVCTFTFSITYKCTDFSFFLYFAIHFSLAIYFHL